VDRIGAVLVECEARLSHQGAPQRGDYNRPGTGTDGAPQPRPG
jgi:hypothetical protein